MLKSPLTLQQRANGEFIFDQGFLPEEEPITNLPPYFSEWEELAKQLPKLLVSQHLRALISQLPPLDIARFNEGAEIERMMMLLSFLGHAYVWQAGEAPATSLPHNFAQAWYDVALLLDRPPIMSYASYALYNWRRIDPAGAIALGNIALLQNFLGGIDEEWFVLVHVDIEHRANSAMTAVQAAQRAIEQNDPELLSQQLDVMEKSLSELITTLNRMPEHCDPYIYYQRVRPYIHGWKNNPALPDGLIYENVSAYNNKPVKFKGETGAQSTIIPVLDAVLGISHATNPLREHLQEMRIYMPPSHRNFLRTVEQGPVIRDFIQQHSGIEELKAIYNQIIHHIHNFRNIHIRYAARYIENQHQSDKANPTHLGTGGTPFIEYLHKHEIETLQFLLK